MYYIKKRPIIFWIYLLIALLQAIGVIIFFYHFPKDMIAEIAIENPEVLVQKFIMPLFLLSSGFLLIFMKKKGITILFSFIIYMVINTFLANGGQAFKEHILYLYIVFYAIDIDKQGLMSGNSFYETLGVKNIDLLEIKDKALEWITSYPKVLLAIAFASIIQIVDIKIYLTEDTFTEAHMILIAVKIVLFIAGVALIKRSNSAITLFSIVLPYMAYRIILGEHLMYTYHFLFTITIIIYLVYINKKGLLTGSLINREDDLYGVEE